MFNIVIFIYVSLALIGIFVCIKEIIKLTKQAKRIKEEATRLGEQEYEVKYLTTGEVVIRTEDNFFFYAPDQQSLPIMVAQMEGLRLWHLDDED